VIPKGSVPLQPQGPDNVGASVDSSADYVEVTREAPPLDRRRLSGPKEQLLDRRDGASLFEGRLCRFGVFLAHSLFNIGRGAFHQILGLLKAQGRD